MSLLTTSVGSFPKPGYLTKARAQHSRDEIPDEAVHLDPGEMAGEVALAVIPRDLPVRREGDPRRALFLDDLPHDGSLDLPQLFLGEDPFVELRDRTAERLLLGGVPDSRVAADDGCGYHAGPDPLGNRERTGCAC